MGQWSTIIRDEGERLGTTRYSEIDICINLWRSCHLYWHHHQLPKGWHILQSTLARRISRLRPLAWEKWQANGLHAIFGQLPQTGSRNTLNPIFRYLPIEFTSNLHRVSIEFTKEEHTIHSPDNHYIVIFKRVMKIRIATIICLLLTLSIQMSGGKYKFKTAYIDSLNTDVENHIYDNYTSGCRMVISLPLT